MKKKYLLAIGLLLITIHSVLSQTVSFPSNPPSGTIGPWGYEEVGTNWDTSPYLPFKYEGTAFRLMPPNGLSYDDSDDTWDFGSGEKYPIIIFFHGRGESGTDNNSQLKIGGETHRDAVLSDEFPGFLLYAQNATASDTKGILDKLIADGYPIDQSRIYAHGLSRGAKWTWDFALTYPSVLAALFPMSGINPRDYSDVIYTPIRLAQGEDDSNPTASAAYSQKEEIEALGGNIEYFLFEGVGHGTWNYTYPMDDFFTWFLSHSINTIYAKYDYYEVCPGDSVEVTLGVTPGHDDYEWAKDGELITTENTHELNVDTFGDYTARVNIDGEWTDWSEPLTVGERLPTQTPPITVEDLVSYVLPDPNGNTSISITLPDDFETYTWYKDGVQVSTDQTLTASASVYTALVQEEFGCSSELSDPFEIILNTGIDIPAVPSGVNVLTLSELELEISWNDNATDETNNELYRRTSLADPYELVALLDAGDTTFEDSGLIPGVEYYYSIRAINSNGASGLSEEGSGITDSDEEKPLVPLNLQVLEFSSSTVTLDWEESTDNTGIDRYEIYQNGLIVETTSETTKTIYNLVEGDVHRFSVLAVDLAGNKSAHCDRVITAAARSGFNYKYYEGSWSSLPDFNTLTPVLTGKSEDIDIAIRLKDDNFAFYWEGEINIPVAGDYTFETYSDDGSKLYIGDYDENDLVVDNDGSHGAIYREGTYNFPTAGIYPIVVTFFENSAGQEMKVYWSNTAHGIESRELIPASVYSGEAVIIPSESVMLPSELTAVAVSSSEITLSWNDESDNEINFQIYRATESDLEYKPIALLSANTTSYTDTDLDAATKYLYKIKALGLYESSDLVPDIDAIHHMPLDKSTIDHSESGVYTSSVGFVDYSSNTKHVGSEAISFEGSNSYLSLDSGGTYIHDSFSERSVAFWMYAETIAGIQDVYDQGDIANGCLIRINEGVIELSMSSASNLVTLSSAIVAQTWTHVAMSFDNGVLSLYIDGVLVSQNSSVGYSSVRSNSDSAALGGTQGDNSRSVSNNSFVGFIDDFYVLNQAIPLEELSTIIARASDGTVTSATTDNLRQPSDPLTNFTAVSEDNSTVSLGWDASSDAYSYQLFRSEESKDDFQLIAHLSPSLNSHLDEDVLPHEGYYYTVRSTIETGYSESSDTLMVVLDNSDPEVLTAIPDYSIFYENDVLLDIDFYDRDGDTLTVSTLGFPSFVSLEEQVDGQWLLAISPEASDFGTYNDLTITVEDSYGGTTATSFNMEVIGNYAPTVESAEAFVVSGGQISTLSILSEDPNGDNLIWTYANVPSFVSPTANGTSLDLVIAPDAITEGGVYTIDLRVDDDNAVLPLYTESQLSITVIPYDPNHTVYVNFGSENLDDHPWNSFIDSPSEGVALSDLVNHQGFITDDILTLESQWGGSSTNGGLESSLFDTNISTSYFWTKNDTEYIRLSGLDSSSVYNFTFFGSRNKTDDRTTTFEINDQSVSLQAANNADNLISINTITPDTNGEILIAVSNGGDSDYAYLNAMIYEAVSLTGIAPLKPTALSGLLDGEEVTLTWVDNAVNETGFEIYRSIGDDTNFHYLATVAEDSMSYVDTGLQITDVYYEVRAINAFGNSDFSESVAITYTNRLPVVTVATELVLRVAESHTLNITAVDVEGDAFTLDVLNIPAFGGTLTTKDTENWSIDLSPSIYDVGNYDMTVVVTDVFNNEVLVPVNLEIVSIISDSLLVNFGAKTDLIADAPWNNLLGKSAGLSISDLINTESEPTGFGIELVTPWSSGNDKGVVTGDNSGLFPDIVMENFIADDGVDLDTVKLTGLSVDQLYDFTFFASRADVATRITIYATDSVSAMLDVSDNVNETAQIKGVAPDENGSILFTVDKGSYSYKYLNALELTYYVEPLFPTAPSNLVAQTNSKTEITLSWDDNSNNEEGFELEVSSTGEDGTWVTLATLGANTTNYQHVGLTQDTEYFYRIKAYNAISPSYYSTTVSDRTYSYLIYINIGAATHKAPSPWNNFVTDNGPFEGDLFENLLNDLGVETGINLEIISNETLTTFSGVNKSSTGGISTGDDSGVYPDVVAESYFWIEGGEQASMELSNMALNQEFDVSFFASRDRTGSLISEYSIGDASATINTASNTTGVALVTGAVADIDGTMRLDIKSDDAWGYIGAIILQASSMSSDILSSRSHTDLDEATESEISNLVAYPNPFSEQISLNIEGEQRGELLGLQLFNQLGQFIGDEEFTLGLGSQTVTVDTEYLNSGMYFLKVIRSSRYSPQVIKIIK